MAIPLYIKQMELGPMQNYVYFLGDAESREVLVVDPAWEAGTILKAAEDEGLKIMGALVTHTHFDHVNAAGALLKKVDCPIYIHETEKNNVPIALSSIKPTRNGSRVKVGQIEIEFIHTPGHTSGSQCFLVSGNLVSGDTLFINSCGRTDLPGGNTEEMYHSLNHTLKKLPDTTILFPGHNYADRPQTTMGEQKKNNPYLICGTLEQFLAFR
jgi:hydroxyacylglutathione hydrolase